jgi:hypothetical protein
MGAATSAAGQKQPLTHVRYQESDCMNGNTVKVDFTYAKNALFVRQTVAAALGVPLGREFTWELLSTLVCDAACELNPSRLVVTGLSNLAVSLPDEAAMFRGLLRDIKARLPSLDIRVVLHD